MKKLIRSTAALLTILPALACDAGDSQPLVARAGDYELTVDEAVRLLAGQTQLPNQEQVVQALGNIWIDYTLLADAASRDSTLAQVNLDELVRQQLESQMIMALRDTVVQVDTAFTDQELEQLFRENAPGSRVRARHILLSFPSEATEAQRDSVREELLGLRRRAEAGESFANLATEYSQDRASAVKGGDLGFFERGEMVKPFDSAAFALEPGEMSGIVESPYGLHLIKVEEKEVPTFEERRAQFRDEMQQQRIARAESTFVAGVEESAELEPAEDAADLIRQIARNPDIRLQGRAASRPLVEYQGGALTAGEARAFLQTRPPQFLQQVATATDEQLEEQVLKALARRELLVNEAEERGLEVPPAERDSLEEVARENFRGVARQLGFDDIRPQEGETRQEAVERVVHQTLQDIVQGQQNPVPMGPVSWTLRQQYPAELFDAEASQVVARIADIRGQGSGQGQGQENAGARATPVDTSGAAAPASGTDTVSGGGSSSGG